MAARALILAKYQVLEDIRQQRRRSKRAKANSSAEQQMKEMATGRIYEGNSVGYSPL